MEIWADIKEFEGYEVSTYGNVRSVDRTIIGGPHFKPRKLKGVVLLQSFTESGYAHISLRKENKAHTKRVHHLVMQTFIGARPKGKVIHHKDGDKSNNKFTNLEYTTHANNTHEWHRSNGPDKGTIKVSEIESIKERINNGEFIQDVANEYNVHSTDIACVYRVIELTVTDEA